MRGVQSSFSESEEPSRSQQSRVIMYEAHECHYNTPQNHRKRKPDMRLKPLQEDIRGNFEYRVTDEKDCQAQIILCTGQIEVSQQLPVSPNQMSAVIRLGSLHCQCWFGRGRKGDTIN